MAALDTIRSDLAAAVTALGWRESRFAPGLFGSDPVDAMHRLFAIDLAETQSTGNIQQRAAEGVWVQTAFVLRYSLRYRVDGRAGDITEALQQERAAVAACVALHADEYTVALERIEARDTSRDGFLTGAARLIAHHLYDLA